MYIAVDKCITCVILCGMQGARIIYSTITLNDQNIDAFLETCKYGDFIPGRDYIRLYNYVIGSVSDAAKAHAAAKAIEKVIRKRPEAIAHEQWHFHNDQIIGNIADLCGNNYYQEVVIHCIDELSARAAGILYSDPDCTQYGVRAGTILYAMLAGCDEIASYDDMCNDYVEHFVDDTGMRIIDDLADGHTTIADLVQLQNNYKYNRRVLYNSPKFHNILREMFTFDGQYMLNQIHKMPDDLKRQTSFVNFLINRVRGRSVRAMHHTIDEIIAETMGQNSK